MPHPYKWLLLAAFVLVPLAIIAYRNSFDRSLVTLLRFVAAVGAAWLLLIGSRFVIVYVDVLLASTPTDLQAIYDGDGAKDAAALFFGWVPAIFIALVSWAAARVWHRLR